MAGNDLSIYSTYASEWWQEGAPRFRSLQNLTPFRLALIEDFIGSVAGKTVYDLGCGGGLLSVPLLDRGAHVCGVDVSAASIEAARAAAQGRGSFLVADVRLLPFADQSADLVLCADLLDHVPDYEVVLSEVSRVLRPGGMLFAGTINRTIRSFLGAIMLGEGLRLIPPGTHDWSLFITPRELVAAASDAGLELVRMQGERVRVFDTIRRWAISLERSTSRAIAYSALFTKPLGAAATSVEVS